MSKVEPQGKLKPYKPKPGENDSVHVHRVGKRRKYIDNAGHIFVKALGQWWKFPEEVEY
ncbi:MAG: hypothetical protein ACOC90_05430 [Bacteroidota bacterium]